MTQKKSAAKAAPVAPAVKVTSPQDVKNMYIAILGREPESRVRITERQGRPLSDIVGELLRSDEFSEIIGHAAQGALPNRAIVADEDFARAAQWVVEATGVPSVRPNPGWAELLLNILQSPKLIGLRSPHPDHAAAVKSLGQILAREDSMLDQLEALVRFDPVAFSRTSDGRVFSVMPGVVDPTMPVSPDGDLPRVLPFFTEGLEAVAAADRPSTLDDLIRATRSAAHEGRLTHWLWHEATYNDSLARSRSMPAKERLEVSPYLEFLLAGDRAGISPHPLFSPYAYSVLNPGLNLGGKSPFRHFIGHGMYEGLRTSALFDAEFYLSRQPHVQQEIASGAYASALEHFIRVGLAAGFSFSPDFDRHFYLATYPDIGTAVEEGDIPSAEWHFVLTGAKEGRQPNRFFDPRYYSDRYPFIDHEMRRFGINSVLEHFLLLGRHRGWRVNAPPVDRSVDIDQAKALFEKRGRRAYSEALDGVFAIDAPGKPKLSVIAPISGQADFTAGFLKCASWATDLLQYKRGVSTEVVIVDNGSKDHTGTLLKALPGVRVVHFDTPIGFPAAVNAGVAASRGEIILVANNDIEFHADAFLRIYDTIAGNPQVGVAGAKVILPNETLQEAGSILDKNGGAIGIGRGLDAVACRGSRLMEVDYASGCFIAFTRADFDELGGLDEAYSPGYYEEVDFSLRMKSVLGKPTVVDTGLAITHYEHASFAKGRPQTVNEPLILRNRLRLRTSHADHFNAMSARTPAQSAEVARRALSGHARVLVVEDLVPSSLLGSGFGREEEILDVLAGMGIPYDIVALSGSPRIDDYKDPQARLFRAWMPGQSLEDVIQRHGADYSHLWLCRTHNLGRATAAIQAAKKQFDLKVVCDTEALSSLRIVEQMRVQGRAPAETDGLTMAAAELADPIGVDLWVAVNQRERVLMERLGLGPVCEIGHSISLGDGAKIEAPFGARERMLFVGAVHELGSPNYDGLEWFLSQAYPRLNPSLGIRLTIAGHWAGGLAESFRARFASLDIDFKGSVTAAELAALYAESRVAIAPTRFAAGIPCKIIESVMAGVPIVMTDLLAEQLDVGDNGGIAAASRFDGGVAFAHWIDTLYGDEGAWSTQREAQADIIGARWTPQHFTEQVRAAAAIIGMT